MILSQRASVGLGLAVGAVLAGVVVWPQAETFRVGLAPGLVADLFAPGAIGWRALGVSVGVSLATVLGSAVVGTGLALALARLALPLRRTLAAVAALPLALPPLVGVIAFLFLWGESGMLPRGAQALFGLEAVPFALGGVWAVVAVHVYVFYVYVYLFVGAALRSLDGALLDAAADLGAGPWGAFRAVVWPHVRPALVGASGLVFMLSMGSFTAPLLFAEGTPFLTTQIYLFKLNGALDRASTLAAVLAVVCLGALWLAERATPRAADGSAKGAARPPAPVGRGAARVLAGAAVGLVLAALALPVATVVGLSFVEDGTWTTQVLPDTFTLANYAAFAEADVLAPVLNSVWMAALATVANVAFGVAAALVIARGRGAGRALLRAGVLLPFAVPGTVVALGLIVAFDAPTALTPVLVGTVWLLPLAYFVRHIPLVARAAESAFAGVDARLAEASADLGAGQFMTLRRVVGPLVAPAVVAGALLTFVTALGEFVASILLYVFDNRPISVEIFAQLRLFALGPAAATSVLLMALVLAAVVASRGLAGSGEPGAGSR